MCCYLSQVVDYLDKVKNPMDLQTIRENIQKKKYHSREDFLGDMQQIVANFISGVILLTDRSIKPDDVIEVDETYGVVKSLGLRYASVITRDGKEHLIPNEMLITDKVVNWSYSKRTVASVSV